MSRRRSLFKIHSSAAASSIDKFFSFNTNIIFAVVILLAIGIMFQMARWQIVERERFQALAQSQYIDSQRQSSSRGTILAADDTVLATDQPSWNVYASLSSIPDEREDFFAEEDKYVATVSGILGIEKEELEKKLTEEFRYFSLAKNIDSETKKALEEEQIFTEQSPGFGFYFEKSEKRIYPNGELASHLLGFMGKDDEGVDTGLYGVEGYYFGDLLGTEGYTYEEQDAKGNVILTSEYEPVLPRQGKSIKLTIVPSIQRKVERALEKGVQSHQAKSGSAILMDPKTGAILALANYPTYNPNEYWRTQEPWIFKNKAVGDVYEPGSIFKPITVAIGLESGKITPKTVCNDATGYIKIFEGTIDEKTIYTWDKGADGKITPEQYLQYSNNPCIVRTALDTGFDFYYPKMREFGIGSFIGLGLQDETNSYTRPREQWTKLDLAVTSFGQSVSVTPMQMISALSVIANDGKRMKPYIVSEVRDEDEVIKYEPQVLAQPISEKTADTVAQMMISVVKKGDPKWIFDRYLSDYEIAGKTGTAQIPKKDEVGYYDDKTNASFVGFAPASNPQMIMLVRLEEPGLDEFAATTAVPVWVDIFNSVVEDLEIKPS